MTCHRTRSISSSLCCLVSVVCVGGEGGNLGGLPAPCRLLGHGLTDIPGAAGAALQGGVTLTKQDSPRGDTSLDSPDAASSLCFLWCPVWFLSRLVPA